jgi:3-dehydroquinate dehydratase-2
MSKMLVLNGPNLNLLGRREPGVYGTTTLQELENNLLANAPSGMALEFFQSNHEGQMIDRIHRVMDEPVDGIVINPGAWTHTSVAIRDALSAVAVPFVELSSNKATFFILFAPEELYYSKDAHSEMTVKSCRIINCIIIKKE